MKRGVFLDRDGVINASVVRDGKPYPPDTAEELVYLPGVAQALADLKAAGFTLLVVTNQPDVARGKQKIEEINRMHDRLRAELPVDRVYCCTHDDVDNCACRKPKAGMLVDGARDFGLDLTASYMVGDRWRDISAGEAAGCRTVFIDYGYDERQPQTFDAKVKSLAEATAFILKGR